MSSPRLAPCRALAALWCLAAARQAAAGSGPPQQTDPDDLPRVPAGRRLSVDGAPSGQSEWAPMRVHADTTNLWAHAPAEDAEYAEAVMQAAVRWVTATFRVQRLESLRLPCTDSTTDRLPYRDPDDGECRDYVGPVVQGGADKNYTIPAEASGFPEDGADLVIYVGAQSCTQAAWALILALEAETARPVAGVINFCAQMLPKARRDWKRDVDTALHEIMHVMGFMNPFYRYYLDDQGKRRTRTVAPVTLGNTTWPSAVVTPRVVAAARRHFACPTLQGVALEDHGGAGSAGSHWEARWMFQECMSSAVANFPRVSEITLALFEDSGWYKPDYSKAGAFEFGKGQGCAFLEERCVSGGKTKFPEDFCVDDGPPVACNQKRLACNHDLMGYGRCSNCLRGNISVEQQLFPGQPDLGGFPRLGFCPVATSSGAEWCQGQAARCVMAGPRGSLGHPTPAPMCADTQCFADSVRIRVGNSWAVCGADEQGVRKVVEDTEVVCPSHARACERRLAARSEDATLKCLFPGVVRHGTCVCPAGFVGEDCGQEDRTMPDEPGVYALVSKIFAGEFDLAVIVAIATSVLTVFIVACCCGCLLRWTCASTQTGNGKGNGDGIGEGSSEGKGEGNVLQGDQVSVPDLEAQQQQQPQGAVDAVDAGGGDYPNQAAKNAWEQSVMDAIAKQSSQVGDVPKISEKKAARPAVRKPVPKMIATAKKCKE